MWLIMVIIFIYRVFKTKQEIAKEVHASINRNDNKKSKFENKNFIISRLIVESYFER